MRKGIKWHTLKASRIFFYFFNWRGYTNGVVQTVSKQHASILCDDKSCEPSAKPVIAQPLYTSTLYISIDVVKNHYMSLIRADNGHICWLAKLGDAIIWRCENCRLQVTTSDKNTAIRDATCHVSQLEPDPPDNPERRPRSPIPWKSNKIKEYVEAENNIKKNYKCYSRGGGKRWGINGHATFTSDLQFHGP